MKEQLFPLARAIDYLQTGDEALIEKLSPEVRGIVEEVVANLKEAAQMTLTTTEEIYEQIVKPLPAAERLRLVVKIVHDLSIQAIEDKAPERHDWMSLHGIAPNLLQGEDAQAWVSATRRESDEDREQQWRRERSPAQFT